MKSCQIFHTYGKLKSDSMFSSQKRCTRNVHQGLTRMTILHLSHGSVVLTCKKLHYLSTTSRATLFKKLTNRPGASLHNNTILKSTVRWLLSPVDMANALDGWHHFSFVEMLLLLLWRTNTSVNKFLQQLQNNVTGTEGEVPHHKNEEVLILITDLYFCCHYEWFSGFHLYFFRRNSILSHHLSKEN